MKYLKTSRFPAKTSEKDHGLCNICKTEITKENRVRYSSYAGYMKKCRSCIAKQVNKFNKKRRAAIKNNPLW